MKKSLLIICIIFALLLSSCGNYAISEKVDKTTTQINADMEILTLEQYVESTPYIFTGICKEVKEANYGGAKITFEPENIYQGEIKETSISLHSMDISPFSTGNKYLIFAQKSTSVFLGYEYYSVENMLWDGSTGAYEGTIKDATHSLSESCAKLTECLKDHSYKGEYKVKGEYCKSDKIEEIYNFSSDVVLITVTEIEKNDSTDRTAYKFNIDKTYKGSIPDSSRAVTGKNELEVGKQYILMLSRASSDSLIYIISSQKSVVLPGSEDAKIIENLSSAK